MLLDLLDILDTCSFYKHFTINDFNLCQEIFRLSTDPRVAAYGATRPERYHNFLKKKMVPSLANYLDDAQRRNRLHPIPMSGREVPFLEAWNFMTGGENLMGHGRYHGDRETACTEVAQKFAHKFLFDAMHDGGRRLIEGTPYGNTTKGIYDALIAKVDDGTITPLELNSVEECQTTGRRYSIGLKRWSPVLEPVGQLNLGQPAFRAKPAAPAPVEPTDAAHVVTFGSSRVLMTDSFEQNDMDHINSEIHAKMEARMIRDITEQYLKNFSLVYLPTEKGPHHAVMLAKSIIIGRGPADWRPKETATGMRYLGRFESAGTLSVIDEATLLAVMARRIGYWEAKRKLNYACAEGNTHRIPLTSTKYEVCSANSSRASIRTLFSEGMVSFWGGFRPVCILHQKDVVASQGRR